MRPPLGQWEGEDGVCQLAAPQARLVTLLLPVRLHRHGVDGLLIAPRRLGLLALLAGVLAEPTREAGRTLAVSPGAAHAPIQTGQRAHHWRGKTRRGTGLKW